MIIFDIIKNVVTLIKQASRGQHCPLHPTLRKDDRIHTGPHLKTMKTIVFLSDEYLPCPSAVGNCLRGIIDLLQEREDVQLYVIARRTNADTEDQTEVYGYPLIRVSDRFWHLRARLRQSAHRGSTMARRIKGLASKAAMFLDVLHRYAAAFYGRYDLFKPLLNAYLRALDTIPTPIDMIVASCLPVESIYAGALYTEKHPQVRYVPWIFDPYADNVTLHRSASNQRRKFTRHLQLEDRVLRASDHILLLDHTEPHFQRYHKEHQEKFIIVEHPTLILKGRESDTGAVEHGQLLFPHLMYAGSLNWTIRPPAAVLDLMLAVSKRQRLHIDLYAAGNATSLVEEFATQHPDLATSHGFVEKEIADQAMCEADILLSIGNTNQNQSPSKIFEYIGTGKPIIHLSFQEHDNVERILNPYPLKVIAVLDPSKIDDNADRLSSFIQTECGKVVDMETVASLYPEALPAHTVDLIIALLYASRS